MTLSPDEVRAGLEIFELKPGVKVRLEVLRDLVPDTETALFFGKAYKLDYRQLSALLSKLFKTTVVQALLNEADSHSTTLQDYIVSVVPPAERVKAGITDKSFTTQPVHEFLPELWAQLEVKIAASITELVDSLGGALHMVQGKHGVMLFKTLATLNKQRNAIGQHTAQIHHGKVEKNLVIFDVSGSVSRPTAEKIIDEVVGMAWRANAALAIVSDTTFVWDPGTFTSDVVMAKAQFGGTHYETLTDVLDEDWATVITVADYDSSNSARHYVLNNAKGHIQQVCDISLVDKASFLAEVVGQHADKVVPLLIGNSTRVLGSENRWY